MGTGAALRPPSLADVQTARTRIARSVMRTPLVPLGIEGPPNVFLKLENLQPIGSFKLRGASNALALASPADLECGVYTASAGNMAQGVAWHARRLGIPCSVVVPEGAPQTKLDAIARLGARTVAKPFAEWWQVLVDHGHPDMDGLFVHPVCDPAVVAGNATIGLEIFEDLEDVDAVVVGYGGGALSCGIAAALRQLRPEVSVYAAEVGSAAPFAASLAAGTPQQVDWVPSFVDGIGSRGVLPEMWPMARDLLAGSIVSSLAEVSAAVRLLVERARVVAEGAGAAAVAGAVSGRAGDGKVVAVVSGGNIDTQTLVRILSGAEG